MKSTLNYLVLLFTLMLLISCSKDSGSKDIPSDTRMLKQGDINIYESVRLFNEAQINRSEDYSAPFDIEKVERDADTLNITISYQDNCELSKFEVIWSGIIAESYPPQTSILIKRITENCNSTEQIVKKLIKIDLVEVMGSHDLVKDMTIRVSNGSVKANSGSGSDVVSSKSEE